MEHKVTLSAASILKAVAALKERADLPASVRAAIFFVEKLQHRRIEVILRTVDDDPGPPP